MGTATGHDLNREVEAARRGFAEQALCSSLTGGGEGPCNSTARAIPWTWSMAKSKRDERGAQYWKTEDADPRHDHDVLIALDENRGINNR